MTRKVILEPIVDHDGILTTEERKRILNRIESAFSWLGAAIPKVIELDGEKIKLRDEIQKLIMKDNLTESEHDRIKKLIALLGDKQKLLRDIVNVGSISDTEALEISNNICGILRAVHELDDLVKRAPKTEAANAKQELMNDIEDKRRWLKYVKKIK